MILNGLRSIIIAKLLNGNGYNVRFVYNGDLYMYNTKHLDFDEVYNEFINYLKEKECI